MFLILHELIHRSSLVASEAGTRPARERERVHSKLEARERARESKTINWRGNYKSVGVYYFYIALLKNFGKVILHPGKVRRVRNTHEDGWWDATWQSRVRVVVQRLRASCWEGCVVCIKAYGNFCRTVIERGLILRIKKINKWLGGKGWGKLCWGFCDLSEF